MKTSFPAQLDSHAGSLDVLISLDSQTVEIATVDESLGWWDTSQCTFERKGPMRYVMRVDGEELTVRVGDDAGFGRALRYMRSERVPIVPRWLAVVAGTVIAAAFGVTSLGASPQPASAAPATHTTGIDTQPSAPGPTTIEAVDAIAPEPADLTTRWNALAPVGSGLELAAPGTTEISRHLVVTIGDRSIRVEGTPSDSDLDNQRIMAALGMAIGASNPALTPAERKHLLEAMGLDVTGANHTPLDGSLTTAGLELHLTFEPGTRVDLMVAIA
jgi:hypothetical protein